MQPHHICKQIQANLSSLILVANHEQKFSNVPAARCVLLCLSPVSARTRLQAPLRSGPTAPLRSPPRSWSPRMPGLVPRAAPLVRRALSPRPAWSASGGRRPQRADPHARTSTGQAGQRPERADPHARGTHGRAAPRVGPRASPHAPLQLQARAARGIRRGGRRGGAAA